MLRRNPTRIDTSLEENEMREQLRVAREARESAQGIQPGITYAEEDVRNTNSTTKTTAERIGYKK